MTNRNLVIPTLLTSVAMVQPIFAQSNNSNAAEPIFEEIVVTAQKREQSIYETSVSVSAFSGDVIRKAGITDLVDVGKFVPNLNVTTFSAGHTASANPFIRGIGLQDHLITTDPGVGVYVDGVYLGRQVGQNWSLSNIERLEVLRGPQGTLYGRNSIGGAINIITRKPGDEEVSQGSVEVGSRGRVNVEFYSNFILNDDIAMLFSGAFKRRHGLGEFLNLPNVKTDVGELRDMSARVALEWTLADSLSLLLAADGNEGDSGLNPYTTFIDEVPNGEVYGVGYRNSDVSADPYDNNTGQSGQAAVSNSSYGLSFTAEYGFSENLDAKLLLSKRRSDYASGLDDDSFFDNFLAFPETGFAEQISVELQFTGEYDKMDFVASLYYFEEEGFNDQRPTTFNGNPGTFRLEQKVESHAIFANLGYQITDDLRISGGLRYTVDEKEANVNLSDFVTTEAQAEFDEISWDFSATYHFAEALTVYGTVANGYQSGQFPARPFCLFGQLDFTQPGNVPPVNCFASTDNITALNYEIGIKGQPFENLQMSLAVFRTEYEDLPYQVSTTREGGFNTVNLVVDQDSMGVEWESSVRLFEGFYIRTAVGYINVEVDDPVAVAPLTPEWTFAISPEYSFSMSTGGTVSLRIDYSYRDDMFGEPSPDPGRFTRIDSRGLVNFNVSYLSADESWTVGLYGRNVADKRYENARLNTGDYILAILSNDASEFGMRFTKEFR